MFMEKRENEEQIIVGFSETVKLKTPEACGLVKPSCEHSTKVASIG
jgi:hypothetical protein